MCGGELRCWVGGRNRKNAHACLQCRLNSGARIFNDETFARPKQRWSGATGVELSEGEFVNRGVGFADGTFVRGHDEFEALFDGRSRKGGEDLFPPSSRGDGQAVLFHGLCRKPGYPGK